MTGEKCKYCPEKDKPGYKGHTVDNCWKVEKAMRNLENPQYSQYRPQATRNFENPQYRPQTPRFIPRRTNFTQRPGFPRYPYQGPRTPFRGNQRTYGPPRGRPFRRQITAAIMDDLEQGIDPEEALNYHLASLGIQDEPVQQEDDPEGQEQEHEEATEVAYANDHIPEEFTED